MMWAIAVAAAFIIAGVGFFIKRRGDRHKGACLYIDPQSEASFYPEIEKCHAINTKSITCSCADFRNEREQFRHDDPRRLCKHLVRSFIDADSLPEDLALYKAGIARSDHVHSGFPTDCRKFDIVAGGKKISIMVPREADGVDLWVDVYCEAGLYRYSPRLKRWSDQGAPPDEREVMGFFCEKMGLPRPDMPADDAAIPGRSGAERKPARERTGERMNRDLGEAESVLRALLPYDEELTLKDTRSYVAVMFNGSRRWVCRLCLRSKKSKYIEFPGGKRYALESVEDIAKYREELLNAYAEKSPKKGKARMLFASNQTALSSHDVKPVERGDSTAYFSRN
jgi:hypothetical protein